LRLRPANKWSNAPLLAAGYDLEMGHLKAVRAHESGPPISRCSPRRSNPGARAGFQAVGIADTDLSAVEPRLAACSHRVSPANSIYAKARGKERDRRRSFLARAHHFRAHGLPTRCGRQLENPCGREQAFVARYALGRDYHKVLRGRLRQLAEKIAGEIDDFGYRVFTDSAPVMEVELARRRAWLAGQAHAAARARSGLVLLSRTSTRICPFL